MEKINAIVKETLLSLDHDSTLATPNNYHKKFCEIAKRHDIKVDDCALFKKLVEQLTVEEQAEIEEKNIETFEDLIPLLLERVSAKNVSTLAQLMKKALSPSIHINLDESLTNFSIKIGNSPELMFEEDIQEEMQKFITKRFEADQNVVKQKTADIAKLVTLMGKYLNDAINSSTYGTNSVADIKDELVSIDIGSDSFKELTALQSKLITAATTIETEMQEVSKKLSHGRNHVQDLESKIQSLESELHHAKREGAIDHLTGLLTRRAYERAAQTIEKQYVRNDLQYAVIFFDIDHFKKINDTYGHDGGDVILSTYAKILKSQTRDTDIVGRYGGEEFVAIIQYKLKRELLQYLKRVKTIIRDNNFNYKDQQIHITFSAGVTLRSDHATYESAIQKSDVLLYEAKESGRNKIILEDGTVL